MEFKMRLEKPLSVKRVSKRWQRIMALVGLFLFVLSGSIVLHQTLMAAPYAAQEVDGLSVEKMAVPPIIFSGNPVTYTFVIVNSGSMTLTHIQALDDHLGPIVTTPFTLTAGEQQTFTIGVQVASSTRNIVTATGRLLTETVHATAEAFVTVITPSITLQAWVIPMTTVAGGEVTYHYQVTNTGNIALTDVVAQDMQLGIGAELDELGIGMTEEMTAVAVLNQPLTSQIIVSATHPLGTITTTTPVSVGVYYQTFLPLTVVAHQWQAIGLSPDEVDKFYSVAVCGEHTLGGTEQGVYSFQDDWQKELAIPSGTIYGITFRPSTCTEVYLTIRGNGLWRGHYQQGNWQWQRVDSGALDSALTVAWQENNLFVGGDFGLKWSGNEGQSWQTVFDYPVIRLSSNPDTQRLMVAVWNRGVYYQDSFNITVWHHLGTIQDALVYQAAGSGAGVVAGTQSSLFAWNGLDWRANTQFPQTTFAVAATSAVLYAGQRHTGILRSGDGGLTWEVFNTGLVMPSGEEFQVRDIHVGQDGFLYLATTNGIWRWSEPVTAD
jgi:hypothetical protein